MRYKRVTPSSATLVGASTTMMTKAVMLEQKKSGIKN